MVILYLYISYEPEFEDLAKELKNNDELIFA